MYRWIYWSWMVAGHVGSAGIVLQYQRCQMHKSANMQTSLNKSMSQRKHYHVILNLTTRCHCLLSNLMRKKEWKYTKKKEVIKMTSINFLLEVLTVNLWLKLHEIAGCPTYIWLVLCPLTLLSHVLPLIASISELRGGSCWNNYGGRKAAKTWREHHACSHLWTGASCDSCLNQSFQFPSCCNTSMLSSSFK